MKRILLLIIAIAMLLAGCNGNAADDSSAQQEPFSSQESILEESGAPTQEPTVPKDAPLIEDEEFYREVLLNYGGEMLDGVLHTAIVGLYFSEDWEKAEDLLAGSFYTWRLCHMWNEDLPDEEKAEKYASPLGPDSGWFFSQEEYEALVQEYFDVSVEYLRSDQKFYDAENKGYYFDGSMGIGERPAIELKEVEAEGDLRRLHIALRYEFGEEQKVLTIRIGSGGAYKFESYRSVLEEITAEPMSAQGAPAVLTAIAFSKPADLTLNVGDTNRRAATTTPAGDAVTYTSSNTNVATVDSTGNVTCKAAGRTVITATSGSVKASYSLTVTATSASSAPSTPAASFGSTASGVFAGYTVTVLDKTTPAVTIMGRITDRNVMCFLSASDKEVGTISHSDYNAIVQKNRKVVNLPGGGTYGTPPVDGKSWEEWFADEFNKHRGLGSGSREEAVVTNNADTIKDFRQKLISLTDAERQAAGMPTLNTDALAMEFAEIRAQEITTLWGHSRPNGEGLTYGGLYFTEIIHKGSNTPQGAINGWMNSDGHRAVLLGDHGDYGNRFGVGVVRSDDSMDYYWVEVFVLWDPNM